MPIVNQIKNLKKLATLSYFDRNTLSQVVECSTNSLYANIKRWLKSGNLLQLKRGLYVTQVFYDTLRDKEPYLEFIANKLREPSYISLEYVLQKYSILAESVFAITSVTCKPKRVFRSRVGTFVYRGIGSQLFIGYHITERAGFVIKEATKAKALFDYLYLKTLRARVIDVGYFASLRLNLDEMTKTDLGEFLTYCAVAGTKKLLRLADLVGGRR